MNRQRLVVMGAAGRDFHDFNVVYRDDPAVEVIAFTATQIPGIANRRYPVELAGPLYPSGIPIVPEEELEQLIRDHSVQTVVFAYSDVSHETVMHAASRVLAAGADFELLGPDRTMIKSRRPVIAVGATRTGAGKSQTTRAIAALLADQGLTPVVIRHPMPYGDLAAQRVQRFATLEDLDRYDTTIEEREEYEPHIDAGRVVFAGVDYEAILRAAELEADVILWDGGNNDFPFYRPDLNIVVADPLRAGDERRYHPGEMNLRMADVVIINKIDSATPEQIDEIHASIAELNPRARVIAARSDVTPRRAPDRRQARGRRRGRPDPDPRRHAFRCRRRGRTPLRRGLAGRPATRGGRLHPRHPGQVPGPRTADPRDGLRRRAGRGPGGDAQPRRRGHRPVRDTDRPGTVGEPGQADHPRPV